MVILPSGVQSRDRAPLMSRNTGEVAFRSLLVTGFSIGPIAGNKKQGRQNTVLDVKNEICLMLGIPERPDAQKNWPKCSVTITYNNMSELSKRIEKFKKEYFPEFERTVTAFLRRAKRRFGDGGDYATCWDRMLGRAEVSGELLTLRCADLTGYRETNR